MLATAALAGALASAAAATTRPGVVYPIKVVLSDKSISIAKDLFTRGTVARYPRGAIIRYVVTNKGSKPYVFKVWGTATGPIKPGGRDSLLVNWNYRGTYTYLTLYRGRPAGPRGRVEIF